MMLTTAPFAYQLACWAGPWAEGGWGRGWGPSEAGAIHCAPSLPSRPADRQMVQLSESQRQISEAEARPASQAPCLALAPTLSLPETPCPQP